MYLERYKRYQEVIAELKNLEMSYGLFYDKGIG